ncbi:MAG TPA: FtsX-like permease family protein, partial [Streptosporangiaceae bacterium]
MIGLGLRLVVSGGREAITRLVVLAVAVGLGVGLLLTAVAATNAVTAWNNRHAWFWTGTAWVPPGPATGVAPLWWHPASDIFNGQTINRFDVAATGTSSPVPPGFPRDPGPGQYYASPALAALLRSTPADQLAGRYPGHLAGTIGDAALPSPSSLVIVVGRTPAQLAHTPDSVPVTSISTTEVGWPVPPVEANPQGLAYAPPDPGGGQGAIDLILSVVALAILAPVLIFIATATRLSADRREERFAAKRLAGATRRQVSLLAATESTVAGILGMAAGFGIFFLLRIPVAGIPFIGQPFFPAELTLSLVDILVVAIGVPVFAAVAALLALRRVRISPLGVARRATPEPPRAWRVVPLLAGLAELGFWTIHGHPASTGGQIQAFMSSFLLIIVGLLIAGPWLTMAAARAMARWTSRPSTLLAARRLADDPKAAFRAVSGLVLALFITTVAVVAITTQNAKNLTRFGSAAEANVLTNQVSASNQGAGTQVRVGGAQGTTEFGPGAPGARAGEAGPGPAAPVAPLTAQLKRIPGVHGVLVVRAAPQLTIPGTLLGGNFGSTGPVPAGVVSCAQLATVPALGRCPAGAATARFPSDGFNGPLFGTDTTAITWPAANVPATRLDTLGVDAINVATNGTTPAVEQARTVLENAPAYPSVIALSTLSDIVAQDHSQNSDYQQLANVVILISLPIAGCTLAAGIAAGIADRKRPFSLLR